VHCNTANRKHDYWIGRFLKHCFVPFVTRHPQRNTRKPKLTCPPPRLMFNPVSCSLLQTDSLSPALFSLDRITGACLTLKQGPLPPFSFLVISTRPVRPVFPTSLLTSLKQHTHTHTQRSHSHLLCQFCAVSRARVPPLVLAQLFPPRQAYHRLGSTHIGGHLRTPGAAEDVR
jgi:hypothetical protein